MSDLQPLINEVEALPPDATHVVAMLTDEAIWWRGYPKSSCDTMAMVMNGLDKPDELPTARVLTREEFLAGLRAVEAEENEA